MGVRDFSAMENYAAQAKKQGRIYHFVRAEEEA
jgi:hypothetical protein